jgi:hypothetical protein
MAGEWVKMRSALLANPKVHAIAKAIGMDSRAGSALTTGFSGCPDQVLARCALRYVTVTALLCVWSSANEHATGGILSCCDLEDIDEIAGVPGFGQAMASVGWAIPDEATKCVSLPNFSDHNTPAKDRTAADRQRRYRQNRNGRVARDVTRDVARDSNDREEKRREEKKEIQPAAPVATSDPPKRRKRSQPADAVSWSADAGWQGITDADRQEWRQAYPACDLTAELAKAASWLKANPTKAHKSNWRRFLVSWLTRSQDKGGTNRTPGVRPDERAPPQPQANRRFFRSDSQRSMTDAEHAAWRRDQRQGGMVAALAGSIKLTEEVNE